MNALVGLAYIILYTREYNISYSNKNIRGNG